MECHHDQEEKYEPDRKAYPGRTDSPILEDSAVFDLVATPDRPTDLFGQKRRRMGDGASSLAGEGQDLQTDPIL